jgi:hypothetical protein
MAGVALVSGQVLWVLEIVPFKWIFHIVEAFFS